MARCDVCGNAPRWIYRVGDEEICGACCANRLAVERAENAKLRSHCEDYDRHVGRVRILAEDNDKLRRELEQVNAEIGDLEDCRESLRRLGEYCGCDHVESPDERQLQVQHIHEAFDKQRQENAKLRERVAELEAFIDSPEDVLTRKEGGDDER